MNTNGFAATMPHGKGYPQITQISADCGSEQDRTVLISKICVICGRIE